VSRDAADKKTASVSTPAVRGWQACRGAGSAHHRYSRRRASSWRSARPNPGPRRDSESTVPGLLSPIGRLPIVASDVADTRGTKVAPKRWTRVAEYGPHQTREV